MGGGMRGSGGRGGRRARLSPLSGGGGPGWLAFAALWCLCLSLPACNMEKTLALLLLLMHVTWADEVKKRETMVFGFWSLAKSVVVIWYKKGKQHIEQRNLEN